MTKHINNLLAATEVIVRNGDDVMVESLDGCPVIWYYTGYITHSDVEYIIRYHTGEYQDEHPKIVIHNSNSVYDTFDANCKSIMSIGMLRSIKTTFRL